MNFKREVITINIGQAGVQFGAVSWQLYCIEHRLDFNGFLHNNIPGSCGDQPPRNPADYLQDGFSSFFMELPKGNYCPRALFVDLEPTVIDEIFTGRYKNFFNRSHAVCGKEDAANNYARGYYSPGLEVLEELCDPLRTMVENCDGLQGFILGHSCGGGTGSGFHSILVDRIGSEYCGKKCKLEVTVFPSMKLSTSVVEPYNTVLAAHSTIEDIDCVFLTDNEAMYEICHARLGVDNPSYLHLNRILAQTVSSITASLRFKGVLNADFIDFQTNLVPYPRIHFPVLSYAPVLREGGMAHESLTVADITRTCFNADSRLAKYNPDNGKFVSICLLYRGDVAPKEINEAILAIKEKRKLKFVDWSPTGFKLGINSSVPATLPGDDSEAAYKAVCMISNTTAIKEIWSSINEKYSLMMKKKAFLHWYTMEGLTEAEFLEAQEDMLNLEEQYNHLEELSL